MEHNNRTNEAATTETKLTKPWIRRHPMFAGFLLFVIALIVVGVLYYILRIYFSTFDRSEQGYLAYSMPSRHGEYVAEIYGVPYGGAGAGGVTIWVDVRSTGNGSAGADASFVKTIYRAKHRGANHLEWENEKTLRIENRNEYNDDTVTLNIEEDIYDGWNFACKSLRMKGEYVRCLSPEKQ
ncbi:hypothetical protein [Paenibacillus sp. DCT19]|uniref:hypothetical protein n=1 Tax=Paenibacillus sp. DCT19 TaxID=2211212 RepID=UPI000FE20D2D|nr:hypothetical protein [Paenibacillus sp. DCT19]